MIPQTNISIKTHLEGDEAQFFEQLLSIYQQTQNGRPENLAKFIFSVGLQYLHGGYKGFVIAQALPFNVFDMFKDILFNKKPPIKIDKIYFNGKERDFSISIRGDILLDNPKKCDIIRIENEKKPLRFEKEGGL